MRSSSSAPDGPQSSLTVVCESVADFGPTDVVRLVLVQEQRPDAPAPSYAVKERVCLAPGADGEPEHCYARRCELMDFQRAAAAYLRAQARLEERFDPWWQRRDVPKVPSEVAEPEGSSRDGVLPALVAGETPLFAVADPEQGITAIFTSLDRGVTESPLWAFATVTPTCGSSAFWWDEFDAALSSFTEEILKIAAEFHPTWQTIGTAAGDTGPTRV